MTFSRWLERLRLVTLGLFSSHPETDVEGIALIDLRADGALDHEQVKTVLSDALARVRAAGNGYFALVTEHLSRVVAADSPLESASPFAQAFNAGFRASDRSDPLKFAAKLVWAATYIRVTRDRVWWRRFRYSSQAHRAAEEMVSRFLERLRNQDRPA